MAPYRHSTPRSEPVASSRVLDRFKAFWQASSSRPSSGSSSASASAPTPSRSSAPSVWPPARWCSSRRGCCWHGVAGHHRFVFSDLIDGQMAASAAGTSKFGAFWDSTLDRVGDGAIFGGLALYFAGPGDDYLYLCWRWYCLVMGAVTSYCPRPRRVARHGRQGRDRRARRPAGGDPRADLPRRTSSTCRSSTSSRCGCWPRRAPSPWSSGCWCRRQALGRGDRSPS